MSVADVFAPVAAAASPEATAHPGKRTDFVATVAVDVDVAAPIRRRPSYYIQLHFQGQTSSSPVIVAAEGATAAAGVVAHARETHHLFCRRS